MPYKFMLNDADQEKPLADVGYQAIVQGFQENTTAHGVPHIHHAKGPIKKIFWLLATIAALTGFGINFYSLLTTYLDYDVTVAVSIEYKSALVYPAVTICNHNPVRASLLANASAINTLVNDFNSGRRRRDLADVETDQSDRHRRNAPPLQNNRNDPNFGKQERDSVIFRKRFSNQLADMSDSEKSELGHQADDLILDCEYAGYTCNATEDFYQWYDSTFGNCFTYNWGRGGETLQRCYRPGKNHGLSLTFNIEQSEYVGDLAESAGLRIVIHPQQRMPFPTDEGISVGPGAYTFVGLARIEISRQGGRYGNCTPTDALDLRRNVYQELYNISYTTKACSRTCYQKHLIATCGCADSALPSRGIAFGRETKLSPCDPEDSTQSACKANVQDQYNSDQLDCDCPQPCTDTAYSLAASSSLWPSDAHQNSLHSLARSHKSAVKVMQQQRTDPSITSRNFGKVSIYYEEFNYESVTESPAYTLEKFFSDLGGILGLYIGFSSLTILEFVELAADLGVFTCIFCRRGRSKVRQVLEQNAETAKAKS